MRAQEARAVPDAFAPESADFGAGVPAGPCELHDGIHPLLQDETRQAGGSRESARQFVINTMISAGAMAPRA